ncbi:UbiD family decarboxylase [Chloroflexota bacterium]
MHDLRQFIDRCKEIGELEIVEGAKWNLEIGAITFEAAVASKPPAILFDNIEGYEAGYRVFTLPCSTDKRLALVLELPVETSRLELVQQLKDRLSEPLKLISPVEVEKGPIIENVITDNEVDLFKFPTPHWTVSDGGRYIGTGDNVIVRDPDEGWVNVSTNRIQIHDKSTATIFVEPGQHIGMIREKYWKRGQGCPVAVTCGGDPFLVSISGLRIPWGVSEYDYIGWWRKTPLEVIKGQITGLPIPANSEIALEGEMVPMDIETKIEGPFAEFTGHYSSAGPEAIFKVKRILHRDAPIILAVITYMGPGATTWTSGAVRSAKTWGHLDSIVPGIRGVWEPPEFGIARSLVISLKQQYQGHAKQAALAALAFYPMSKKYIIVVDEDIDPTNINEVLFAMGQRANPKTFEVITGNWTSKLEPLLSDPEVKRNNDLTVSTSIILACKPFHWIEEFPQPVIIGSELQKEVRQKWPGLFERI